MTKECEGWNGKSVRDHIRDVEIDAGAALELAREAHDEIADIWAVLEESRLPVHPLPIPQQNGGENE